jgi:hypothetical protein
MRSFTTHSPRSPQYMTYHSMTFAQELCNALTIVAPSLLLAFLWFNTAHYNNYTLIIILSTWIHMLISASYHMMCAFGYFKDRINCAMRKLDQSLIHMCCITFSYALSGDTLYGLTALMINAWYITRLWVPGTHDTRFGRLSNLFVAIMLSLFPIFIRGDYINYFGALGSFIVAAVFFQMNEFFHGWGHAISHLCYCQFLYFLFMSSIKLSPKSKGDYLKFGALNV